MTRDILIDLTNYPIKITMGAHCAPYFENPGAQPVIWAIFV